MGNFTYLGYLGIFIINKDGGNSEEVKNRIAKAQSVFSQLKNVWKNTKTNQQTKTRIMEATVMRVAKYGSEAWQFQKADEDLLDFFQRKFLWTVLFTRLIDRI